jgi:post-segregation antitoxin (ccd killing protein)
MQNVNIVMPGELREKADVHGINISDTARRAISRKVQRIERKNQGGAACAS